MMQRCQASGVSEVECKTFTDPYPAAAQPQLPWGPSLMLPAVQCHHPSLTPPATTRVSRGRGTGYTQHATAQPTGRSRAGQLWSHDWKLRSDTQGQAKPAESFTSALPAHLGPGEQLVSCEHVARDRLQDTSASARHWLTALISQGRPGTLIPLSQSLVPGLAWVLWLLLWWTQHSSEWSREMLLPPKMHTSMALAHSVSVHIAVSALSFVHTRMDIMLYFTSISYIY